MKFSLLTLGALAFSAQQASLVRGEGDNTSGQQAKDGVCNPNSSLSFNITRAGESVLFTCSETVSNLDPAFSDTIPEMYEGNSKVRILEFLPGATLQKVETTGESRSSGSGKTFNFTVPILPSDEHQLHVNCTKTTASTFRNGDENKDCKVTFNIASSAVRAGLAMSAVVGVVASLLQFA
ncbi:SAG-related sequence SRS22I [Toxoplasma gondii ME49]|uniref:SRS22I n=3 Tax=Toxoplasma gondii TaxID=5811 RepID=B6KGD7_TOXGV|nr:SAG-related sequence SRS22I [Toxoplasma gondii ME49]EPT30829.1 SAG-related sequence SRS22I [Toxoplasma gondii ME49]ESS31308.1 SAG-related sequence SRS22I [Toxoplasma gondii VEG]CEL73270.1 TPA: SRS22I [Toxoplasma gondii VEG]|eukprot:XP_002366537.1 SAG-related sequence SRS22I [Toxoplasma gondii ME49]